jgi:acetoin utilization deacetylase AcuC-like enzyme
MDALLRVHSLEYLESVTEPNTLAKIFGLEVQDVDVDTMLKAQRRAAGGTYEAGIWASRVAGRIAYNLGGGFHHAEPNHGGGFCIYNDVAASIQGLRHDGYSEPIAVIDLDFHQGNGNSVAFADDATVLTYSLQGPITSPSPGLADIAVELPTGTQGGEYLATLRRTLTPALREHAPGLIFFVAGTDVLAEDALGEFQLSERGVFLRDQIVLDIAEELRASMVVTLAGGYSPSAWLCSARMLRWSLTGSSDMIPARGAQNIRRHFGQIASRLDPYELMSEDRDAALTEEDLMGELDGSPKATRFLGYYSVHGVELAFERYGFLGALRAMGFRDLRFEVDPSDAARQGVSVYGSRDLESYHLLVQLLLTRRKVGLPTLSDEDVDDAEGRELEALSIEWLLLQDPTADFATHRVRLPGQDHPGLGMMRELMEMLYQACLRLRLDALVMHPSAFHIAAVGASQCTFVDPTIEGEFQAMRETLRDVDIAQVSRLLEEGKLQRSDGSLLAWQPEDFVAPVSERARKYFESASYVEARERAKADAIAARMDQV